MLSALAAAIPTLWGTPAGADLVELKNGSRIVGEVASLDDGKLVVETAFAGTIHIDWAEVVHIDTERELIVRGAGGDVRGRLRSEDGDLRVESTSAHVLATVPLADVRQILPDEIEPRVRWFGAIDAGAELHFGSENEQEITVDSDLLLKTRVGKGRLGLSIDRERDEGKLDDSEIRGTIDLRRDLAERVFASLAQLYEQDISDGIDFRAGIVPGFGYRLIKRNLMSLTTEAGIGYLHQRFDGGGREDLPISRFGLIHSSTHFSGRLRAENELTFFAGLSSKSRFLVRDNAKIRWRLAGPFSVGARAEMQWANEVAPDIDQEKLRFYLTLGYEAGDARLHW